MSENGDIGDLEPLAAYLAGPGKAPGIGAERGRRPHDGIATYKSPHGSTRYVWYEAGRAYSVLQVVSRDGKSAAIANVYTAPSRRRMGIARFLLQRARRDFQKVTHADEAHLSPMGRAWKEATNK